MTYISMTGFGVGQNDCPVGRLTIELRSVNSRFLELHFKIPDEYRWLEPTFREQLQSTLQRGKVELRLSVQRTGSSLSHLSIHPDGLAAALRISHEIRTEHPELQPFSVSDLIKLPGILQEAVLNQEQWSAIVEPAFREALDQLSESRQHEGQKLGVILLSKISELEQLLQQAAAEFPAALAQQEQRLRQKFQDAIQLLQPALEASNDQAPEHELLTQEKLHQDIAAQFLRMDIGEELDRLQSHLGTARGVRSGKKLDFLAQELQREANTMGSKSGSTRLSSIAIEMKLLIEQIREQAQNLQ